MTIFSKSAMRCLVCRPIYCQRLVYLGFLSWHVRFNSSQPMCQRISSPQTATFTIGASIYAGLTSISSHLSSNALGKSMITRSWLSLRVLELSWSIQRDLASVFQMLYQRQCQFGVQWSIALWSRDTQTTIPLKVGTPNCIPLRLQWVRKNMLRLKPVWMDGPPH